MFAAVPYKVQELRTPSRKPVANAVLVALNVLAFFWAGSREWHIGPQQGWWSVVGYGFAHASPWHLIGNMFVLLLIGNPVNRRLGHLNYLSVYLGTLVVLGLIGRIFGLGPVMGASGAIFAVVAVFLMLMPAALVSFSYVALFPTTVLVGLLRLPDDWVHWFITWGVFPARAWWCFLLVPAVELWGFLWWRFSLGFWNWTHPGHLLGFLCGIGVVLLLPRRITMGRGAQVTI